MKKVSVFAFGLLMAASSLVFADQGLRANAEDIRAEARELSTVHGAATTDESGTLAEVCGGFMGRASGNCIRLRDGKNWEYYTRAIGSGVLLVGSLTAGIWSASTNAGKDAESTMWSAGLGSLLIVGNSVWDYFSAYAR